MQEDNKKNTIPSDFKWCYYTGSSMDNLNRISLHIAPDSSDIFVDNIDKGNVGHVQACHFRISFPVDEEGDDAAAAAAEQAFIKCMKGKLDTDKYIWNINKGGGNAMCD